MSRSHLGCSSCFGGLARDEGNFDHHESLLNGQYADQVKDVLRILGQLTIIPAVIYWHHADLVVRELLHVIQSRCGRRPASDGTQFSTRPPRTNSHWHPLLEAEVHPQTAGPALARYFQDSTQYVYDRVYGAVHEPRISVVPPLGESASAGF